LLSPAFLSLYVDPGSGSMILQLLLGGVSGLYVIFRLFKQRILSLFGIKTDPVPATEPLAAKPLPEEAPRRQTS
jgi:hypothetical protein